jgi:ribose transport system permease protein
MSRLLSSFGMVPVLLLLCAYYSVVTLAEQPTAGAAGGEEVARHILKKEGKAARVLIVVGTGRDDGTFAHALARDLNAGGATILGLVQGQPSEARKVLEQFNVNQEKPTVIAATWIAGRWALLENLGSKYSALAGVKVVSPRVYLWPNFLKADNLLNITNQIAIIAILAIGMTLVIITGGIDLSVGSLLALSAVVAALLIRDTTSSTEASALSLTLCCLAAIGVCGAVGLLSGLTVTLFAVPPFIATLAMMLIASGAAEILSGSQSIYDLPESFVWLDRGTDVPGIRNSVLLTALLYVIAHIVMTRMTAGRYIYAVGGNPEAARLAGVPVKRVQLAVYVLSGLLAGLGGVILASRFLSGAPTYGVMYELYVIAAVVVGGTSLSGGEGNILGTLVGTLIIAVIQNGMNLTGVQSPWQKVMLGSVILGAVLLDRLKKRG